MANKECYPTITSEDSLLFNFLNIFKFLDLEFIQQHVYTTLKVQSIYKRVLQLEYHQYLKSIKVFQSESGNASVKKIIFLGEASKDFLDFNLYHVTPTNNNNFEHYIKHQLFLADVLIHFYNATTKINESNVSIERLISESELSISSQESNLRPDAGFILRKDNFKILYFLEVERSYAKESNVGRKIYKQYNQVAKNIHRLEIAEKNDIDAVRVLFVSSTRNLMQNLISKVSKMNNFDIEILFTSQSQINEAIENDIGVLSNIYSSVNSPGLFLTSKV